MPHGNLPPSFLLLFMKLSFFSYLGTVLGLARLSSAGTDIAAMRVAQGDIIGLGCEVTHKCSSDIINTVSRGFDRQKLVAT